MIQMQALTKMLAFLMYSRYLEEQEDLSLMLKEKVS